MRPDARQEWLLLEELGDELVVYDVQRHRAHQLNRTAALVWRSCDGHKTVAELRKILQTQLDPAIDEAIVWQALDKLHKARLLREPVPRPAGTSSMTRRQALRKLGRTAALALLVPAVTSITAPAPLRAAHTFVCNDEPCINACKNECVNDFKPGSNAPHQCPSDKPRCQVMSCSNPNCVGCTQRRCVKAVTEHGHRP
jgi:Coenzyme PQQ synthesis protein D (PqqD)